MTEKGMAGQTSRAVVGAEIQKSCNFDASLFDHYHRLGCYHCRFNSKLLLQFARTSWYDILSPPVRV